MERDGAVSRAATELRRLCDDLEQYCWQLWDGRTSQWDGMRRSNERIESSLNTSCQHPAAVPFTLSTVFEVQSNIQNRGLFRGNMHHTDLHLLHQSTPNNKAAAAKLDTQLL